MRQSHQLFESQNRQRIVCLSHCAAQSRVKLHAQRAAGTADPQNRCANCRAVTGGAPPTQCWGFVRIAFLFKRVFPQNRRKTMFSAESVHFHVIPVTIPEPRQRALMHSMYTLILASRLETRQGGGNERAQTSAMCPLCRSVMPK